MREIGAPLILQPRVRWGGAWSPTSQRAAHYRPRRAQGRGEDMGVDQGLFREGRIEEHR